MTGTPKLMVLKIDERQHMVRSYRALVDQVDRSL